MAQKQATTLKKHAPVVQNAQAQRQGLPQRAKPIGCNGVEILFAQQTQNSNHAHGILWACGVFVQIVENIPQNP
ncbi:MAG: hypothetical protein IKC52_02650 [Clostridia bacterium]|nr:hypothetical protein [Clostridia bacterium]